MLLHNMEQVSKLKPMRLLTKISKPFAAVYNYQHLLSVHLESFLFKCPLSLLTPAITVFFFLFPFDNLG